ncbi:MAG: putative sulfate exporter family transporter [Gemmatimonadetes bacterium]|nr:putative sulfate exporter family transporter [Gemmatimonadota bacterium]
MNAPRSLAPGILLAALVGLAAVGLAELEVRRFGHAVVEGLVLAIVLGMIVRTAWALPAGVEAGVRFTAQRVLEVAVLLLGASVNLPLLVQAGPALAVGIVLLVVLGLAASYAIGRALGLSHALAVLVASGNAICGNSAIAAVAPVIGASREDVASSIAFTAILGVVVVLGLPFLLTPLALSHYQYGVLAGLTVYAVPQVLAAAFPVSVLSGQVGTLVKLVRVLMLGPVVLFFAVQTRRARDAARTAEREAAIAGGMPVDEEIPEDEGHGAHGLARYVPWFIAGFLALAGLRSAGVIPEGWVGPTRSVSGWLTVAAMAALGLGVDVRAVGRAGRPVVATVTLSLLVLLALSVALIRLLGIG